MARPAASRATCAAEGCADAAQPGHYLCLACWTALPLWLCRDIARARVTGQARKAEQLRTAALARLRGDADATAYARIAAQLGERDAAA